jgi:hypothetical protein
MKHFVKHYAEYKAVAANAARHIATLVELNRAVDQRGLLGDGGLGLLEQDLAMGAASASAAFKRVRDAVVRGGAAATPLEKARLVMLFLLRHGGGKADELTAALRDAGVPPPLLAGVAGVLRYSGGKASAAAAVGGAAGEIYRPAAEQESDLTRHVPWLATVMAALAAGKLGAGEFPACGGAPATPLPAGPVVLFVVGGVTYAEAKLAVCPPTPRHLAF